MKYALIFSLSLMTAKISAQEQPYQHMQGIWHLPTPEADIELIIDFQEQGNFSLFIYNGIIEDIQKLTPRKLKEIKSTTPIAGYLKILKNEGKKLCTEILMNEEVSTNLLEADQDIIYIFTDSDDPSVKIKTPMMIRIKNAL